METFYDVMRRQGISRRSFLKYCSLTATSLGLGPAFVPQIAHAMETKPRTPIIWIEGLECTCCSESFIRSAHPLAKDAVLIEQGKRSPGLHVLLSGQAEVVLDGRQRLATLGPGDICGEMSLLAASSALATVRTTSKALVFVLPAETFRGIIMTHPQVLMFVGELADERKRKFEAILQGAQDYEEGHLEFV